MAPRKLTEILSSAAPDVKWNLPTSSCPCPNSLTTKVLKKPVNQNTSLDCLQELLLPRRNPNLPGGRPKAKISVRHAELWENKMASHKGQTRSVIWFREAKANSGSKERGGWFYGKII